MKVVSGYVLDIPGGNPIVGVAVTVRDKNTGAAITNGTPSSGTVNTDATGFFEWKADLSPGPVYADAQVTASEKKKRYGGEVMQIGRHWLDDFGTLLGIFTNGVISNKLNQFAVTTTGSSKLVTIATGHAIVDGYLWTLETAALVLTSPNNTTLTNRLDRVVLKQEKTGAYAGRQTIYLKQGTVTDVEVALQNDLDVAEFAVARLTTPLNGNPTALDQRVFATQGIANNSVTSASIVPGAVGPTDLTESYALAAHVHGTNGLQVEDGATIIVSAATIFRFDGAAFSVTDSTGGRVAIAPVFGSGAGTFAEGSHAHSSYALLTGATFTGATVVQGNTSDHFVVRQGNGTQLFRIDSLNSPGYIDIANNAAFRMWSGAVGVGSTLSVQAGTLNTNVVNLTGSLGVTATANPALAVADAGSTNVLFVKTTAGAREVSINNGGRFVVSTGNFTGSSFEVTAAGKTIAHGGLDAIGLITANMGLSVPSPKSIDFGNGITLARNAGITLDSNGHFNVTNGNIMENSVRIFPGPVIFDVGISDVDGSNATASTFVNGASATYTIPAGQVHTVYVLGSAMLSGAAASRTRVTAGTATAGNALLTPGGNSSLVEATASHGVGGVGAGTYTAAVQYGPEAGAGTVSHFHSTVMVMTKRTS